MNRVTRPEPRPAYQIKVRGKLNQRWSDWLGGVSFRYEGEDTEPPVTTLIIPIADQSALRGTLNKLWDLNLTLLSVARIDDPRSDELPSDEPLSDEPRLDEPFDE